MATDAPPKVSIPYSGFFPWVKDCIDTATGSEFFKNRDYNYCLNLCSQIRQDLNKLDNLKLIIEGYFYRPSIENAGSDDAELPPYFRIPVPASEEDPVELKLNRDKAQDFATKFNEFKIILLDIEKKWIKLKSFLDDNHNIPKDLYEQAWRLNHHRIGFQNFEQEKNQYTQGLEYTPPGKNARRALNSINGLYTHVIHTPSKDFFNYLSSKTQSKTGAVAVLAFGAYSAYLSYNFIKSDYIQITSQVLFWGAIGYSVFQIIKLFKKNIQESPPEITIRVTAVTSDGSLVKIS